MISNTFFIFIVILHKYSCQDENTEQIAETTTNLGTPRVVTTEPTVTKSPQIILLGKQMVQYKYVNFSTEYHNEKLSI